MPAPPHDVAPRAIRGVATVLAVIALLATLATPPSLHDANVIVVLVDALRADHLGLYGYALPTTPFMDRLARDDAVVFEQAFATASQTVPSVLSLWSSTHPSGHGNQYFPEHDAFWAPIPGMRPAVPPRLPLMAELFQARGYATAAVVTNPWLHSAFGFSRGFDVYEFLAQGTPEDPHRGALPGGAAVNAAARRLLRTRGERPVFLYLHYMDVHYPYEPPDAHRDAFAGSWRGPYDYRNGPVTLPPAAADHPRALYDACIRHVDDLLRELIGFVEETGLRQRTLLVIASDHGEEFLDHGGMGHGWTLYEEMLRVPLLLVHPALAARGTRIATPVSLIDVLPTILELTGGAVPRDFVGVSRAGLVDGTAPPADVRPVATYAELGDLKAIRRGPRKVIRSLRPGVPDEAFDVRLDPAERRPVSADRPWTRRLASQLERFLAQAPLIERPVAHGIDPAIADRLRALGYAP